MNIQFETIFRAVTLQYKQSSNDTFLNFFRPFNLKNAFTHMSESVEETDRNRWRDCALHDWETFLTCRAKEIKPGNYAALLVFYEMMWETFYGNSAYIRITFCNMSGITREPYFWPTNGLLQN